ncbi:MAG: FG-GAP repeat domain-containing protein [Phycisphaerales bacterium]
MANRVRVLAVAAALAGFGAAAQAQWLTFSDETASRLQLTTVTMSDNQEKDMRAADLDKDGRMDIVVGRKIPFTNQGPRQALLLMNDNGVLKDRTALYAPGFILNHMDCRDLVIADFDGDTWLDIVFASTFQDPPRYYRNRGDDAGGAWLGLADESARIPPIVGTPNLTMACSVSAGDLDGDLDLDLHFVVYNGDTDFMLINDGSGNFTDQTAARLGNYANSGFGTATEMRDFDLDGDLDLIKVTTLFGQSPFDVGVFILWNNGSGVFNTTQFHEVPGTSSPYMVASERIDPGPTWDLFVIQDPQDQIKKATVNGPNSISWTSGNLTSPRTNGFGGSSHYADIDNDGDVDLGVGPIDVDIENCGTGGNFALLRNDGNGNFTDPYSSNQNINIQPHDFVFVDINNDGCLDIFMGLCTGWKVFIRQSCPAPPCYADCNTSGSLTVADFGCFQGKFVLGDPYADCNGSGSLTVGDFGCFQGKYVLGCP